MFSTAKHEHGKSGGIVNEKTHLSTPPFSSPFSSSLSFLPTHPSRPLVLCVSDVVVVCWIDRSTDRRPACLPARCSHRAEELRNIYQEDIHYFVQHGSSLLKKLHKTRPASQNSEQVLKLVQYVKEGHNALLYINRCHDTGHVPSAASLQSLEHTLIRVHKASNALQVRNGRTGRGGGGGGGSPVAKRRGSRRREGERADVMG